MQNINLNIENIHISDSNITSSAVGSIMNTTGVTDILTSDNIDEKIASTITVANNLMSEDVLLSLTGQVENITQQLTNMSFSMADQYIDKCIDSLFDIINNFFQDAGILDVIQKGIDVTNTTINYAKLGLNIASSGTTITANAIKFAQHLDQVVDETVTYIPQAREILKMDAAIAGQMFKEIILGQYNAAKQKLLDLKNSMICTSNDAVIDNVIASINGILDTVGPLIDPYLTEYTGYSVENVRLLCNTGFKLIDMITRGVKIAKMNNDIEDETSEEIYTSESIPEGETAEERAERLKKECAAKSKAEFDKHKKDFNKEEAKEKLMEWLQQQNILLQNAFYLVIIKNLITDIQVQCQKLQNSGIENIVDFLNIFDIIYKIFNLIGYIPESHKSGITFDDITELASLLSATALASAQNVSDQITNNARSSINANIQNGRQNIENIKNTQDIIPNNIEDELYNGIIYEAVQDYSDNQLVINMTVYANPMMNSDIANYIKSFKQLNGKKVFNNIRVKNILDNIQDAWDDKENISFEITAKSDNITKKFIFNITISDEEYNKYVESKAVAAAEQAGDNIGQQYEKSMAGLKNAISELANVNINIDMSLINGYFKDKVLIFDCVVKLLDSLYPVYQLIKALAHLLENYKINKEFIRTKQRVSIAEAVKTIAQTYNNIKDIINLENTNFFAVRTQKTSEFIYNNFGNPNKDGILTVDIEGTYKLYNYCIINHIIPQPELSMIKGTTFYFDIDKDGNYKDGTLDGLDNAVYNEELNEVYYNSRHRSTVASQILRSKAKGYEPLSKEIKMPNSESQSDFSSFFEKITVNTDEFEGQQAIDLNNMYCCPMPDLYDIANNRNYYDVIEFADEYTGGDAIQYSWNVKPGDYINENTILAYIHKDNVLLPVKSIFSKGKVMETSNHEFMHIYPDSCNRHICLCDTSIGNPTEFDYNKVQTVMNRMAESDIVYSLIINNMVRSLLPILLHNAYRIKEVDQDGNIINNSNVTTNFTNEIKAYDQKIQDFGNDIKSLSSDNNIKGNIGSLNELGNQILSIKNDKMYNYIKAKYNELINTKYTGDYYYIDSKNLALKSSYDGNIGSGNYNNYYMQLIANINMEQDNKYVKKYFNLINEIIKERNAFEKIDIQDLINQFNTLFNAHIYPCNNAYGLIDDIVSGSMSFEKVKKAIRTKVLNNKLSSSNVKYDDNYTYKQKYQEMNQLNADENEYGKLYDRYEQYMYKDDKTYNYNTYNAPINQLSNIYIAIKHIASEENNSINSFAFNKANANNTFTSTTQGTYINPAKTTKELIQKEAEKILNFWKDTLIAYENDLNFEKNKKELTDYMYNIGNFAEWPQGFDMTIGNDIYKLYTFIDKKEPEKVMPDLSDVNMETINIPDEPEIDYTKISDINGPGNITILDYNYWLVYMANATLFTLLPIYWANGFDMPPAMTPTLLPAIYFPIMKPINIPIINVTLVLGLAIRGIWIFPILLVINQNSQPINVIFPAIAALEMTKSIFDRTMSTIENGIPMLIDQMINQLSSENAELKKNIDKFRTYSSIFRSIPIKDKALIEEEFKAAVYDVQQEFNDEKERRKAERNQKKRDKRQVITREENLGDGMEPL
ncbi:MAG: hypothetical protein [Wendovervirus sonii]|uniref:Uncharacterized protein n=1 Tax=phage Lak_Megaphage_Sonny TaxID=3109229 RepID=A0ABZ0Z3V9_9CAUD|nr:MAG: hypothetical protein [phage Lak_Megaphage_Sonny]